MRDVSGVAWLLTVLGIIGLLLYDFFFHVRKAHIPSIGEAARWTIVYISIAVLFWIGVLVFGLGVAPTANNLIAGNIIGFLQQLLINRMNKTDEPPTGTTTSRCGRRWGRSRSSGRRRGLSGRRVSASMKGMTTPSRELWRPGSASCCRASC